jgi:hypothetical protein
LLASDGGHFVGNEIQAGQLISAWYNGVLGCWVATNLHSIISLTNFGSALTTSGWKKYPDTGSPLGYFIEQWSVTSVFSFLGNGGSGQQNLQATYPVAFPNAVLQCGILSIKPSLININVFANIASTTLGAAFVAINNNNSNPQSISATVFAKGF